MENEHIKPNALVVSAQVHQCVYGSVQPLGSLAGIVRPLNDGKVTILVCIFFGRKMQLHCVCFVL